MSTTNQPSLVMAVNSTTAAMKCSDTPFPLLPSDAPHWSSSMDVASCLEALSSPSPSSLLPLNRRTT